MPPKKNITSILNDAIQEEKSRRSPNLYTALEIDHETEHYKLTDSDIISLAQEVSKEFLEIISAKKKDRIEDGSKENPYQLDTTEAWFLTAADFSVIKGSTEQKYFRINQQLFVVEVKDRYISFDPVNEKKNFTDALLETLPALMKKLGDPTILSINKNMIAEYEKTDNIVGQIETISPLALYLIQEIDATVKKTGEEKKLQRPTYSSLAEVHSKLENQIEWALPLNLDESTAELNKPIEEETEVPSLNIADIINQVFNSVSDEVLTRFGLTEEQKYIFYNKQSSIREIMQSMDCTSMLSNSTPKNLFSNSIYRKIAEQFGDQEMPEKDWEDMFEKIPDLMKEINLTKFLSDQAKPLNNLSSVVDIRDILSNKASQPRQNLYPTVAPLFFSEASRYPISFVASLAILDLIQHQKKTPDTQENYSVQNLLENPKERHLFVDAYGVCYGRQSSCQCSDCIDFKGSRENLTNKIIQIAKDGKYSKDAALAKVDEIYKNPKPKKHKHPIHEVICGYHPMVQGNSFLDAIPTDRHYDTGRKNLDIPSTVPLNLVEQKISSILLDWLSLQLSSNGYRVELKHDKKETLSTERQRQSINAYLKEKIKKFLMKRIESFDFMNTYSFIDEERKVDDSVSKTESKNGIVSNSSFRERDILREHSQAIEASKKAYKSKIEYCIPQTLLGRSNQEQEVKIKIDSLDKNEKLSKEDLPIHKAGLSDLKNNVL